MLYTPLCYHQPDRYRNPRVTMVTNNFHELKPRYDLRYEQGKFDAYPE